MTDPNEAEATRRLDVALRFYGPPPFEMVVSLGNVAATKLACERRGWTAVEMGQPGRLRIEGTLGPECASHEDRRSPEDLGKELLGWLRRGHLSKAKTMALAGTTQEEADHLFASRFHSLGAERIRIMRAQLQASLADRFPRQGE